MICELMKVIFGTQKGFEIKILVTDDNRIRYTTEASKLNEYTSAYFYGITFPE